MPPCFGRYLAAAALLLLWVGGMHLDASGRPLKEGTEVFAVDPGKVLEVSYRTSSMRLMAHRWDIGDRFTIIFMEQSRSRPAICPAGQGFETVLKQLTSLKLRRTLPAGEAQACLRRKPLNSWAEVVIRDNSELEPFRALIMPLAGSSTEALVHFHGATYIVSLEAKVFQLISGGCKSLADPDSPRK